LQHDVSKVCFVGASRFRTLTSSRWRYDDARATTNKADLVELINMVLLELFFLAKLAKAAAPVLQQRQFYKKKQFKQNHINKLKIW
jgi:hypothetical protein